MNRELILSMSVSLDGFVAGPNGEVDWMFPAMSEEGRQWVAEKMSQAGLLAMGNASYQAWVDFWPKATSVVADPMNALPKVVFSRSGAVSTAKATAAIDGATDGERQALQSWIDATPAGADLVADVQHLKAQGGKPILALGGIGFSKSLIAAKLVDVYRLSVHPVLLGQGIALYGDLEAPLRLHLDDVKPFSTGAMVKTYRPVTP